MERTIQQGADAVGSYLHRVIKHPVIIVGCAGIEHYPNHGKLIREPYLDFIRRLPYFADTQYFYSKNQRTLVVKAELPKESNCLYVLMEDTEPDEIVSIMEKVEPAKLALSYYLRSHLDLARNLQQKTEEFFAGVFIKNNIRVDELLARQGVHLDPGQKYAVMLIDLGENKEKISPAEFRADLMQYRRENQTVLLYPVKWRGFYLVILSGLYQQREYREFLAVPDFIQRWRQAFCDKYQVELSIGIGEGHPLAELYKSYREARIALVFRQIKGECGFIQCYAHMGIFRELFSEAEETTLDFCRQTLDKLLEYDHDCDAELQTTLRTLLKTNFSYKLTAELLFVHVNTVRYRCEKISQLLAIDMNDPDTRFNLYAAIRVGDVLKKLNVLQPGYIGSIRDTAEKRRHTKSSQTVFGHGCNLES